MLEDQLDPVEMLQKHVFLPLAGDPLISLASSRPALKLNAM